jgi:hypothetical protein
MSLFCVATPIIAVSATIRSEVPGIPTGHERLTQSLIMHHLDVVIASTTYEY